MRNLYRSILAFLTFICTSCYNDVVEVERFDGDVELKLHGSIDQEYSTRVDDSGFANGDAMGVYIIDYNDGVAGQITDSGLRASNVIYTYDAASNTWSTNSCVYWRDTTTPVDIYGYYPAVMCITSPDKYTFEVSDRQNGTSNGSVMSNYEASDFLWGKVEMVAPTETTIMVNLGHRMAGVKVQLVRGAGITESEWKDMEKQVQVDNTMRHSYIDLSDGVPVAYGDVDRSIDMLAQADDTFRAVVVPQTVAAGKTLISATIDGYTYTHSLTQDMIYAMGKLHNFTLTVNRKEVSGDFECNLSYGGVGVWENDTTSHNYEVNTYVVVEVAEPGGLQQRIEELGIDPTKIENLKLVGNINEEDFDYIRSVMSYTLCRINLKEVNLTQVYVDNHYHYETGMSPDEYVDDYLPYQAFRGMVSLRHIILPDSLKEIGEEAFYSVQLNYPLILPEGLTHIHDSAFMKAALDLEMPYSLVYIGDYAFQYMSSNTMGCSTLRLTDDVKYIGKTAFCDARCFKGSFYLPANLEYLGPYAFCNCGSELTGDIVIPLGMTEIPIRAFMGMGFHNGTNLYLHDNIEVINTGAFASVKINNPLVLPANLTAIGEEAFYSCGLTINNLVLPEGLRLLGHNAFGGNTITGTIEEPDGISMVAGAWNGTDIQKLVIGDNALYIDEASFSNCPRLEYVHLGKNIEYIGRAAFANCRSLSIFVCMAETPPVIYEDAFGGIYLDKCILQVPEKAIESYRKADYWKQFKNITVYKELAFNIPQIVTSDKGCVREGIIRAEGEWEVVESPSWVTVSPNSGSGKAQVWVSVDSQSAGSSTREGNIVFALKNSDYTTYTTVRQVGGDYAEDQTVVLQEASAGAARAIPLFIVGDGYDADDVASGKYLEEITQQMEYFFSIEPLKSYRDYFTVSTAYAVSPESGIDGLTKFDIDSDLGLKGNDDKVLDYARKYGVGINGNEANSTIIVLENTNLVANTTSLRDNDLAISYIGKSLDVYPFDQRGNVLHECAGIAFGKLGPEGQTHQTFISACGCAYCNLNEQYNRAKLHGWWQNVSKSNKYNDLPWYHLIFHEKYSSLVDVYEGACRHVRGAYRSENQSVMGDAHVSYFNTISREALVRRIMKCAGEEFSFEDFVAKDIIELPEELLENN